MTIAAVMLGAWAAMVAAQGGLPRRPLEKTDRPLKTPESYARQTRVDPKTAQEVEYDPKPEIVPIDAKSGRYRLRWIGQDGRQKTVTYQRPDRIDAVVAATAARSASAGYRYTYRVRVLPSSGQRLVTFWVQHFAKAVTPIRGPGVNYAGPAVGSPGHWVSFFPDRPGPGSGQEGVFELESDAPPGLVECRVSGASGAMEGAGEEMPSELADALLGYAAWPHGRTVGPVDELAALAGAAKAEKLLDWLPQFERLGWMTAGARQRYERTLRNGGVRALLPEVEKNLVAGEITTEVAAVVEGLSDAAEPPEARTGKVPVR